MAEHIADPTRLNIELDAAAERLDQAQNRDQYLEQVFRIFDIYGVGHGCLHSVHRKYTPSQAIWRVTPEDVTKACSYLVETENHPAIKLGQNRHFPFDLFDYRDQFKHDGDIEALYEAFEANGVDNAYGLPIQTPDRGTFVFVVARPESPIETVELLTLQAICSNAVNGVQQFTRRPCDEEVASKISQDERRMLLAVANGASITTMSEKLNISELTVRSQIDHLVEKVKAQNVSHAVVLMLIKGEIGLEEINSSRLQ